MNFKKFKDKLLKNPKFKKEYERENIADNIIDARLKAGLTQEELAQRMGTKQESIARWENESGRPSLTSLDKIAKALETELIDPTFKSIQKKSIEKPMFNVAPKYQINFTVQNKNIEEVVEDDIVADEEVSGSGVSIAINNANN